MHKLETEFGHQKRSTFMIKALQRAAVCPTIIQCESHLNIDNSQSKLPDTQQVWSGFVLK